MGSREFNWHTQTHTLWMYTLCFYCFISRTIAMKNTKASLYLRCLTVLCMCRCYSLPITTGIGISVLPPLCRSIMCCNVAHHLRSLRIPWDCSYCCHFYENWMAYRAPGSRDEWFVYVDPDKLIQFNLCANLFIRWIVCCVDTPPATRHWRIIRQMDCGDRELTNRN